ncbi:accessory factor UbiK family protein [Nitrincola iocasae]|uniref:Ubiquinone biosynthesis accessory factor UbiK n=1 Tax=Nitrincola iocasae TaxID=2614693 RepID=A0A5J6LHQ9_9GAMM|nr:accessory factor UbiK family protein [Nitrincola iocasae]QEW08167.1 accessory factor UbiK family protein [Nitrincola iocasae]
MIHQKIAEGLSEQFTQFINATRELPGQQAVQQQLQAMLQQTLSKLDLVTREEFDAQQAVLLRTREKLEVLEKQVAALEVTAPEQASNT